MLPTTATVCYGASTLADGGSISGFDPTPTRGEGCFAASDRRSLEPIAPMAFVRPVQFGWAR